MPLGAREIRVCNNRPKQSGPAKAEKLHSKDSQVKKIATEVGQTMQIFVERRRLLAGDLLQGFSSAALR